MFPQSGQYLKNIMKSSGYETIESILKLRYREELNKMFDFIKSVSDIIEDKEEMFGVFKSNPNKVTLIPGLEVCISFYSLSRGSRASFKETMSSPPVT